MKSFSKITNWYYVDKDEKGKEYIFSYGDSSNYTQEESFKKAKAKYPNCRIATKEDCDRLF